MKKQFPKFIVLALILAFAATGCVSKKKYQEMEALKTRVQDMLDKRGDELNKLKADVATLTNKANDCEEARLRLANDTTRLAAANRKMRAEYGEMKLSCDQVNANYQKLKTQSTEKMRDMVDQLETLQRDLNLREKRLAEVEGKLHQRDSIMNLLRSRVTDALLGFKDDGLTVEIKDGKVYVSLSNKLLFASGSTKIDANGQKALIGLANVLKEQKDLAIMVEGHTDDQMVSNLGSIKDNWDLSVMRSTEVVRILVTNGVEATRVIPAGHGEFIPKVPGSTPEARASNRRTEIVISPKLDELYQLINEQR
jgi:chemotaxis protein MotB